MTFNIAEDPLTWHIEDFIQTVFFEIVEAT